MRRADVLLRLGEFPIAVLTATIFADVSIHVPKCLRRFLVWASGFCWFFRACRQQFFRQRTSTTVSGCTCMWEVPPMPCMMTGIMLRLGLTRLEFGLGTPQGDVVLVIQHWVLSIESVLAS